MGAPYIARAPKKVLVRIPRNEGYTTVPSGMATLRLIPSPLDKPQEPENAQTESRGASPLDRPPQFTTGVPTTYSRSLSHPGVLPSGNMAAAGPVQLGRGGPGTGASVQSEADRFVALQGRGVGGPRGRAGPAVYHNERSSSPAGQHHQHGGLAPSAVGPTGTTSATGLRATPLHYQGHFTAHGAAVAGGRCHQGVTHSATRQQQQQQQPPPFTDFIAGQVWRALMMASQQQRQQQQLQQQQQHQQHAQAASGGVRGPVVGGKRTRDVATASSLPATQDHDADADEPSRKISRVNPGAPVHGHHAQSGPQDAPPQHTLPQAVIYTTPTVSHTGLHLSMPSPPSSPTTLPSSPQQQGYTTRFHTSIPTPPTTPPSIQHPCTPTLDDTAQLAHPESPKLLLGQPQQPLVPLSPPALSLPIMFPPVFPQSMNSTKSHPQQFPLSNSSSGSSSSGSVVGSGAVSGSGGRGCEGQGAPPHQQASQLTVAAGVSPRPTHPLHRLSHHPLAALLQTTHGLLPVSAAHGVEGTAATAMSHPYLPAAAAATAPLTPMMRMGDRSGPEHHRGVRTRSPGLYRGIPLYTNSRNTNDKTSFNRSSISDTNSSSSRAHHHAHPPTTSAGASASSPVHNDTNTSLTSNCT